MESQTANANLDNNPKYKCNLYLNPWILSDYLLSWPFMWLQLQTYHKRVEKLKKKRYNNIFITEVYGHCLFDIFILPTL
jgi:hypothetical protein